MNRIRWQIAQFFEINWWKHYLHRKSIPDYLHWKRQYWEGFLKNVDLNLTDNKELNLLDAGCGPAGIFMNFTKANVTAIDPLLQKYGQLDHFNEEWYPNVDFRPSTLEGFEVDKPFDLIFCINAINHVDDLQAAIDKLYALAKPEGQLIITTDAHKFGMVKKTLQLLPADILHPHQYDANEYGKKLNAAGWQIENVQRIKKGNIFDYYLFTCHK